MTNLRIEWEVVLRAAALALAVAVPTIVLGATVARDSNVIVLLYFVFLGGQVAAGWYAGRNQLEAPLVHGALASLTAFATLVVVIVVARAIAGKSGADPFNLVFHAFMASSTGIFGALIATRSTTPPKPPAEPRAPTTPESAASPAPAPPADRADPTDAAGPPPAPAEPPTPPSSSTP